MGIMTTTENTEGNISISPLAGAILQASIQQVGETTDQLLESKDREIAEWQDAFAILFDRVSTANESVDSMKIDRILNTFSQRRNWAAPDVEFR